MTTITCYLPMKYQWYTTQLARKRRGSELEELFAVKFKQLILRATSWERILSQDLHSEVRARSTELLSGNNVA